MITVIPDENVIRCIGQDNKIHVCKPHEVKTKCGIPVKKKNTSQHEEDQLYSCCECTY